MVFVMEVLEHHKDWIEAGIRERKWVSMDEADALLVEHPAHGFLESRAATRSRWTHDDPDRWRPSPPCSHCGQAAAAPDLILHNARIYTVDANRSTAEAIAIRGDRIARVGANAEVLALRGSVDARDRRRRRDDRARACRMRTDTSPASAPACRASTCVARPATSRSSAWSVSARRRAAGRMDCRPRMGSERLARQAVADARAAERRVAGQPGVSDACRWPCGSGESARAGPGRHQRGDRRSRRRPSDSRVRQSAVRRSDRHRAGARVIEDSSGQHGAARGTDPSRRSRDAAAGSDDGPRRGDRWSNGRGLQAADRCRPAEDASLRDAARAAAHIAAGVRQGPDPGLRQSSSGRASHQGRRRRRARLPRRGDARAVFG